jgi:hypothetical protein
MRQRQAYRLAIVGKPGFFNAKIALTPHIVRGSTWRSGGRRKPLAYVVLDDVDDLLNDELDVFVIALPRVVPGQLDEPAWLAEVVHRMRTNARPAEHAARLSGLDAGVFQTQRLQADHRLLVRLAQGDDVVTAVLHLVEPQLVECSGEVDRGNPTSLDIGTVLLTQSLADGVEPSCQIFRVKRRRVTH